MTNSQPEKYDALDDIVAIAHEIHAVIKENDGITTVEDGSSHIIRLDPDGIAEFLKALTGKPLTAGLVVAAQEQVSALDGVNYIEVEEEPILEMPELSLLNFGVWVKRNSEKF